ncbi:MAG: hypothetical protein H0W64_07745 [Gammaproteobacteria bacterium]|nr:hypothetical protein [Gammaproteobacteria bacterium]
MSGSRDPNNNNNNNVNTADVAITNAVVDPVLAEFEKSVEVAENSPMIAENLLKGLIPNSGTTVNLYDAFLRNGGFAAFSREKIQREYNALNPVQRSQSLATISSPIVHKLEEHRSQSLPNLLSSVTQTLSIQVNNFSTPEDDKQDITSGKKKKNPTPSLWTSALKGKSSSSSNEAKETSSSCSDEIKPKDNKKRKTM